MPEFLSTDDVVNEERDVGWIFLFLVRLWFDLEKSMMSHFVEE